jgi:hypothetical protein
MTTLIYRNKQTDSFIELFNQLANDYASKLTFVTREEYLAWRKQWKEDFKIVEIQHKFEKWDMMKSSCVLPRKIEMYEKKLKTLPAYTAEQSKRIIEIQAKYISDFNLKPWAIASHYVVWYMQIIRKAGKIRAGKQRELQQKNKVAA